MNKLTLLIFVIATNCLAANFSMVCDTDFPKIKANARKQESLQKLCDSIVVARKMLERCSYLKESYPKSYELVTSKITRMNIFYIPIKSNVCGISVSPETIAVSEDSFNEDLGCYGNLAALVAHEMLHSIGLPGHEEYETAEAYYDNDDVEMTLKICYLERGILNERY